LIPAALESPKLKPQQELLVDLVLKSYPNRSSLPRSEEHILNREVKEWCC
jgi:hypothetical protein